MYSFSESMSRFYRNYVNFNGRAQRSEYWWPQLFQLIVFVIMGFAVFSGYGGYTGSGDSNFSGILPTLIIAIGSLILLANFIPNLSVSVRRFHDLGQTGWLVLVFFLVGLVIPGVGIAQWIWFAIKGNEGPNQYGPDPRQPQADIFG